MRYVMTWAGAGGAPEGVERHCPLAWREFERGPGLYDFGRIAAMLDAQATPVQLQLVISMFGKSTGLVDYTPDCHKRSLKLTAGNGRNGEIPNYAAPGWCAAYWRAIEELAGWCRGHERVAGYQVALGLNQETQATVITSDGSNWNQPAAKLLDEEGYYEFIRETVKRAVQAWGPVPVYVPGAPSPGTTWGRKRRDVVVDALKAGGRYLSCGLLTDNSNATGLGVRAGQGMTDIIRHAAGCAFEGGREAGDEPLELYWWLLRARHWGADFVQLQRSWFERGHWAAVKDLLPRGDARWLAFRDSEHPAQTWTGTDGQYGQSGEADGWGRDLRWIEGGELRFNSARLDRARWTLAATDSVRIGSAGQGDGPARVRVTYTDGGTQDLVVGVIDAQFVLPAGPEYHRVDVLTAGEPALALPEHEPVASVTKVRWWLEELARTQERAESARAGEILYSLIKLAYRLEEEAQ